MSPDNRTRNKQILLRVSDSEKKRIESLAQKHGMRVSEYLRHLLAKIND